MIDVFIYSHHLLVRYYCCIHVGLMYFVLGSFLEVIIIAVVNRSS